MWSATFADRSPRDVLGFHSNFFRWNDSISDFLNLAFSLNFEYYFLKNKITFISLLANIRKGWKTSQGTSFVQKHQKIMAKNKDILWFQYWVLEWVFGFFFFVERRNPKASTNLKRHLTQWYINDLVLSNSDLHYTGAQIQEAAIASPLTL